MRTPFRRSTALVALVGTRTLAPSSIPTGLVVTNAPSLMANRPSDAPIPLSKPTRAAIVCPGTTLVPAAGSKLVMAAVVNDTGRPPMGNALPAASASVLPAASVRPASSLSV